MTIIEIEALENGAHRNQTYHGFVPEGWAVIPNGVEIPETFPFVDVAAENGVVTTMTAGTVQEAAATQSEPTELEQLRADVDYIAMETGVEL